jgi:cytochrome c
MTSLLPLIQGPTPLFWDITPLFMGILAHLIFNGALMMRKILLVAFGLALALGSTSASAADLKAGAKIFKKCKACHSLKAGKKKVGPSLHGVLGNKAAGMKKFKYSKAMKKADITWDDKTLDAFLKKPKKFLKGTKMSFAGLKKQKDRDNVIAYIKENAK